MDQITRGVVSALETQRKALGLTQAQVASAAGIRQQKVDRILGMKAKTPALSVLYRMAEALELDLLSLIKGEPTPVPDVVAQAMAAFRTMDASTQQNAARIVLDMAAGAAARKALQPSGTPLDTARDAAPVTGGGRRRAKRTGGRRA